MSTVDPNVRTAARGTAPTDIGAYEEARGSGWLLFAGLSAIAALLSIPAYPLWSLAVFAVDVLIIYGLAAYGGQHRRV